ETDSARPCSLLRSVLHRVDDLHVAAAAAEVAGQAQADLLLARLRILLEQALRRQHHPGRAPAALARARVGEGALHRMVAAEALDGRHVSAGRERGEEQAPGDRLAVDEHRARAAD